MLECTTPKGILLTFEWPWMTLRVFYVSSLSTDSRHLSASCDLGRLLDGKVSPSTDPDVNIDLEYLCCLSFAVIYWFQVTLNDLETMRYYGQPHCRSLKWPWC